MIYGLVLLLPLMTIHIAASNSAVTDECANSLCWNRGTCKNTPEGYRCDCQMNYDGTNCENFLGKCHSENRCNHLEFCVSMRGGYRCEVTGKNFVEEQGNTIGGCQPNPCHNGGICRRHRKDSFMCHCRKGFTGSNCDLEQTTDTENVTILSSNSSELTTTISTDMDTNTKESKQIENLTTEPLSALKEKRVQLIFLQIVGLLVVMSLLAVIILCTRKRRRVVVPVWTIPPTVDQLETAIRGLKPVEQRVDAITTMKPNSVPTKAK